MNSATEDLLAGIVAVLDELPDVHPAVPMGVRPSRWLPWEPYRFAVDLAAHGVEIRIVAASLPLSALTDRIAAAIRPRLAGSAWAEASVRVHVVALHADAVSTGCDPDHDRGP
ncbi:hypothetical protein [Nocardia rhizosphaerae]|uniref:Asp23/Gls24 family envelope stress response protein n=1 Tax=Nocardia rhizosphaerae TaxID=1691571 RepID=A0ABV8LBU1_9NOCA